ncbi:glycine cleavage system aminomethyltransferase GcvT [Thermopetrobacter sp. TC1]|uniref:glycine cleavage system aminomethyltransferase GcvT n=1 Tax=Thermopetrobacter sp. TC1 TaxID=1495045 RepID=UPI00068D15D0|nr:glycine cleavage system aminomethyltransferase GcvT [Thermopetrobacter sp. TC1]
MAADSENLKKTPLFALHERLGARMVPFAGYAMPVQYEGIIAEHQHTRESASLFDVSHMGQASLVGPDWETVAAAMERLNPAALKELAPGRMRYGFLLNEEGGIIDDLMVTRPPHEDGRLMVVFNAARKDVDAEALRAVLPEGVELLMHEDRALLALQGPKAEAALARHCPEVADLYFMEAMPAKIAGIDVFLSRSGYTGEDGFEISVPAERAEELAELLLNEPEVKPAGLGARDTLRLEAGLCLYGNDIDETTSPVEAALTWAIGKRRREAGDFPGAARILKELAEGPARKRVGFAIQGRAPVRAGAEVLNEAGEVIGRITSGGFGPTVGGPVAMGYVAAACAEQGTPVTLRSGRREAAATVASPTFTQPGYRRRPKGK